MPRNKTPPAERPLRCQHCRVDMPKDDLGDYCPECREQCVHCKKLRFEHVFVNPVLICPTSVFSEF